MGLYPFTSTQRAVAKKTIAYSVIGRSHMTIGMTMQTGRHTDRRYRSHRATGVQTGVPTDRRYLHT